MSRKYYVGYRFKGKNGGCFELVEQEGDHFFIECVKCKDNEAWCGNPRTKIDRRNLCYRRTRCLCSKRLPQLTKEQAEALFKIKCASLGYTFKGWAEDYKGSITKALIISEGGTGRKVSYGNLRGKDYKPKYKAEKLAEAKTVSDEDIQKWMSVTHPQYTFLRRYDEKPRHLVVSCNICSYDKFVQAGICSGEFSSFSGSLKGTPSSPPSKCCRCSDNFRWSKEQREFQVKERLKELGGEWIGWKEEVITPTYKEKFKWVCKEGHHVIGDIDNFLRGKSCKVCYKSKPNKMFNGYDPDRKEDDDLLYVIKFKDEYIKCGRAFIIEKRLKYATGLLKKSGCTRDQLEILHVYNGTHQEVYDTEQLVIDELTDRGFYHKTWTRETFTTDSEKLMVSFIENHSTLTKVDYIEGM